MEQEKRDIKPKKSIKQIVDQLKKKGIQVERVLSKANITKNSVKYYFTDKFKIFINLLEF